MNQNIKDKSVHCFKTNKKEPILFIRIEQSIDLSVHSLWSLEGQRFCCLLGFFLRQVMEKLVINLLVIINIKRSKNSNITFIMSFCENGPQPV